MSGTAADTRNDGTEGVVVSKVQPRPEIVRFAAEMDEILGSIRSAGPTGVVTVTPALEKLAKLIESEPVSYHHEPDGDGPMSIGHINGVRFAVGILRRMATCLRTFSNNSEPLRSSQPG